MASPGGLKFVSSVRAGGAKEPIAANSALKLEIARCTRIRRTDLSPVQRDFSALAHRRPSSGKLGRRSGSKPHRVFTHRAKPPSAGDRRAGLKDVGAVCVRNYNGEAAREKGFVMPWPHRPKTHPQSSGMLSPGLSSSRPASLPLACKICRRSRTCDKAEDADKETAA